LVILGIFTYVHFCTLIVKHTAWCRGQ